MSSGATSTKRMSVDEKRKVILDIYHKTKAVYTEKEIISLATKAGVNANTIVDINQALVDDGLVDKEKIGGSNYFWSFPAKKDRLQQIQYEKTLANITALEQELIDAKTSLINAQRGREDEDADVSNVENIATTANEKLEGDKEAMDIEDSKKVLDADDETMDNNNNDNEPTTKKPKMMSRKDKLQRLKDIEQEKNRIMAELETLKENDPLAIANLEKELQFVKQAAMRWTDNIYNCQTYLIKKRNMTKKDTYKLLGITDSFDYPEDKMPK